MKKLLIGNSMKPKYGFFSWVIIKEQPEYFVGDAISFVGKNGFRFCHRIIKISNGFFTAKGDNRVISAGYETDVPIGNIIGKIME